jgi:oxalate decarboxylase
VFGKILRMNGRSSALEAAARDPGPVNVELDRHNPSAIIPPATDAGAVPQFKYSFSMAHKRLYDGGWSHEVTARELPISTTLAGVLMRLTAGGVRELHWHTAAEWAIMLYGEARVTALDLHGKSFVADTGVGDLWYFPPGIPHSIQGLRPDGAKFLLVFDDGNFSEHETVLLTDWIAHTPREVLAKNFGISYKAMENFPTEEKFIFQADLPKTLSEDRRAAAGSLGNSPREFVFRADQPAIIKETRSGNARIVDSTKFRESTTVVMALVTLRPGGLRELHWHPNADEWQYYMAGKGRMTVFATGSRARTLDFETGDVGYVQKTLPHYIENTGNTDLKFLEMFRSSEFQELALSEWLSHTPPELVMQHLNIDRATLNAIPKEANVLVPV